MLSQYNLDDFEDSSDFLMKFAAKLGALKKGGVPDTHKAAQRVLSDWTNGKLTYFTEPPERAQEIIHTELVTQMKEAFDIDTLLDNDDEEYDDFEQIRINTTQVTFDKMNDQDIRHYLASGNYKDKSGAYGTQSYIGQLISHINGCFYSVMGLPLNTVREIMNDLNTHQLKRT